MPTFTHFLEEDQQTELCVETDNVDVTAAPTASSQESDQLFEQGNTLINYSLGVTLHNTT